MPVFEEDQSGELKERIERLINTSKFFMKGTPDFPQCGFSANVVGLLNNLNVQYKTFDISDMDIRQGVKEYANFLLPSTLVGDCLLVKRHHY